VNIQLVPIIYARTYLFAISMCYHDFVVSVAPYSEDILSFIYGHVRSCSVLFSIQGSKP